MHYKQKQCPSNSMHNLTSSFDLYLLSTKTTTRCIMKSLATVPLTLYIHTAGHTFVSDIIFHLSAKHLDAIISDLATNLSIVHYTRLYTSLLYIQSPLHEIITLQFVSCSSNNINI